MQMFFFSKSWSKNEYFRILSSNVSKQTPSKGKRPAKYDYNSPVKSVVKPPKPKGTKSKEKKKVKLFPAGVQQEAEENCLSLDGINELPATPLRPNKPRVDRGSEEREPRRTFSKQTPSPQPFSLADFIKTDPKKTGSRSPKKVKSRIKSSTPNPESFVSRLDRVEEGVKNLDLDSKDLFPEIGNGEVKKRRIKPITLTSLPAGGQPSFGTISHRPGILQYSYMTSNSRRVSLDSGLYLSPINLEVSALK